MEVFKNIKEIRTFINNAVKDGKTIGFVPTMGFLHEGHMSLVKNSKLHNNITVMSIFVNPTQFVEGEDYDKYPRDFERDLEIARQNFVDAVFIPETGEIYPDGFNTSVTVSGITDRLCGVSRPGHFRGVATIVNKLFNIVKPDRAYFGQKDAQQALVIEKMAKDLNMEIEIVVCPIIREKDGLAMSSRNKYLDKNERKSAVAISRSLFKAEEAIKNGVREKVKIMELIKTTILSEKTMGIDYIEVLNAHTLEDINSIKGGIIIAVAVKIGQTRLIDNIILEV